MPRTENLQCHFCSEHWTNTHNRGKHKINQVVVYHLDAATDIQRPVVEPVFNTLQGGKSTYAYLIGQRTGLVGGRTYGGWCEACQRGLAPEKGLTSRLHVPGCSCADGGAWAEIKIDRNDAAGVANRRKVAQAHGKALASKLRQGSYIAVQARERWSTSEETHLRAGHFWLAKVVAHPGERAPTGTTPSGVDGAVHKVRQHDGSHSFHICCGASFDARCCMLQVTQRRLVINGTTFTEGDFVIAVQWYDRLAEDLEGLKFRRERPEDHEDNGISIVNSTELRAADVDVRPLVPTGLASSVYQPGTRRQPARSGRRAAVVERAAPPELPADTVYEIRADTDALIRRECW